MKKLLLSLFAVLTATFAFAGDGTKTNPYTVAELQAMDANTLTDAEAWVKAYIAGSANNKLENFVTTTDGAVASNLMLADAQSETDYSKCVPMQLSSGSSARKALNLVDNPDNLGKLLLVKGTISKYFSVVGIKNASEWELSGDGVEPQPDPDKPDFSEYEQLSVAQFLEKKDTETKFKVTGIVGSIKNTTYGNFNLVDLDNEDVYIYVYGLVDYKGTTKIWGSISPKIEEKDTITIVGSYTLYNETTDEIVNAIYVEHKKFTGDKVTIENTPETAYTTTKAVELIDAGQGLSDNVYVKGKISKVGVENKDGDLVDLPGNSYGNATYFITDGTTEFEVYRGYYLNNENFTAEDQIKVGDDVIVYGQLTKYKETYEMAQGNYIYSLNGKTSDGQEDDPYATVEAISIADFLQKADTETQYKLTGVVRNIANATYGNFDLCDKDNEDTKIYIYGVVKQDDLNNNKIWGSLDINEGDILTIVGTYTTYKDNPQIAKAIYIKHEKGSDPVVSIANTAETAYTATEANDITNAGKDLGTPVYVKGKIASISEISLSYGNATFEITDGTSTLLIFRTKYLDNENFSSEDQVKVGDEVIVLGTLKIYNNAPEMVNGQICKLNDTVANGISQIVNGKLSKGQIYDLSGRRVEKAVKGIYIVNGKKVVF